MYRLGTVNLPSPLPGACRVIREAQLRLEQIAVLIRQKDPAATVGPRGSLAIAELRPVGIGQSAGIHAVAGAAQIRNRGDLQGMQVASDIMPTTLQGRTAFWPLCQ